MKKTILSIAICSVTILSCNKKNVATINPNVENNSVVVNAEPQNFLSGSWRTFIEDGENTRCEGSTGTCTDDVIVTIAHKNKIDFIFSEIESENTEAIQNAFSEYQDILANYIYADDISKVIDGTYNVKSNSDNPDNARFMLIKAASSGNSIKVYPFK